MGDRLPALSERSRRPHRRTLVAPLAVVVVVIAGFVASRPAGVSIPRLPVLGAGRDVYDGDIGDPFVLAAAPATGAPADPAYIVFGTNDRRAHVPTATTRDLQTWSIGPDALPELPAWAAPERRFSETWAPAVVSAEGSFVMYLSVREASSERECIAVTRATTAGGPYGAVGDGPLVCQTDLGGSIDPAVVRESGRLHLLWKNDGNCCGIPVGLWEQELAPDGLSLEGKAHRLLGADQKWQGGIIENPAMLAASSGGWWLFYSGNLWNTAAYGTGVAYCTHIEGPCKDSATGPVLMTEGQQYAPGGLDVFTGPNGAKWVSYATWNRPSRNGRFFCCRSVDIAPVLSS